MTDTTNDIDRLNAELALLEAMYPDTLTFHPQRRELSYHHDDNADSPSRLLLRIPSGYPSTAAPEVLLATGTDGRQDLRDELSRALRGISSSSGQSGEEGEECLDTVLNCFDEMVDGTCATTAVAAAITTTTLTETDSSVTSTGTARDLSDENPIHPGLDHSVAEPKDKDCRLTTQNPLRPISSPAENLTVIIWLHHLLSTTKRKHALHPPGPSTTSSTWTSSTTHRSYSCGPGVISGLTKPGTPGVMIFSGPSDLVTAHVASLKAMRWQAFQVRYEYLHHYHQDRDHGGVGCGGGHRHNGSSEKGKRQHDQKGEGEWKFQHGTGVVEVESMADVVGSIVGDERKKVFLGVMKIR